ncbi:hypothetical protein F5X99DRAFT_421905 [Biscogniauxia marginata]|nr:hypothetical protein F5X99DRAFT_421905 [Biscogniauxia marginata]
MAPSNAWPPNTLYEWMIGQNLPRGKSKKSKKPRTRSRLAFEVSTDDESESDVYKITLPSEKRDRTKKVRFVEEAPKSGLKAPKEPSNPVPAEPAPEKLKQEKQAKNKSCQSSKKDTDGDDAKEVHAQHKAKKAKQAEEANAKKAKQKKKDKGKKKKPEPESESEVTETTDTEPETEPETEESEEQSEEQSEKESEKESEDEKPKNKEKKKEKGKEKQKNNQKKNSNNDKKGGKKNKKQKSDDEEDKTASEPEPEPEPEAGPQSEPEPKTPKAEKKKRRKDKKVTLPPHHPPPEVRHGNFLLPPRSHILHVEHAVEAPDDPRPNAFYDNENGVMRVYHGPAYGNPYGALYPKRIYRHQPLPVGTPHPMYNPWYNGFQTVAGQPVPPHVPPQTPMRQIQAPQNGSPDASRWFQGYGMTTPAAAPDMPPAPDFEAGFDKKKYEKMVEKYSPSPPKKSKEGYDVWDSNVMPFPNIDGSPSPQQGSDRSKVSNQSNRSNNSKTASTSGATKKMDTNKLWGAQSASGSKKGSDNGSKKDDKVNATKASGAYNSTSKLRKSLEETMAKDLAEAKQREERWSNRSGSKEASPQPNFNQNTNTDGWGMTNDNTAGNNNTWEDNTWGGNGNATNTGSGDVWGDNTNAATTGTTWGYDKNNDNRDDAEANRVFEWVGDDATTSKANNAEWDAKSTKSHKSNNGSPPKDADSSTPVPGGWFSPPKTSRTLSNQPPSNASGGNVIGGGEGSSSSRGKGGASENNNYKNNTWEGDTTKTGGWGDPTAAQSTGGFWEKEEKKEKGKEKEADAYGAGSSSWW